MKLVMSLKIAKTALQEIRLLLQAGKVDQALEIAEALRNLPLVEANKAQTKDIERCLIAYFNQHPERKCLSHWEFFFGMQREQQQEQELEERLSQSVQDYTPMVANGEKLF